MPMNEHDAIIHVVDDDDAMRRSLIYLLDSAGWRTQDYASGRAFLERYDGHLPGCLVLDVMMPLMGGMEVQQTLVERGVGLPIIFLSAYGDLPMAVAAMKRGAVDFLEKPCKDHVLLDAVGRAVRESIRQCQERQKALAAQQRLALLTARELEVVECLAAGDCNKTIARKLAISEKTVQAHRQHAMEKLAVHSTAEIARLLMWAQGASK
jgi:two-component system response regulator FixJ